MNALFIVSIMLTFFTSPLQVSSATFPSEKTITIKNTSDKVGYFYYFDKFNDLVSLTIPIRGTQRITSEIPLILYAANQEKTSYILYDEDVLELAYDNGRHYFNSNNKQFAATANLLMALDRNLIEVLGKRLGPVTRIYDHMLSVPPARDSLLTEAYEIDRKCLEAYSSQRKLDPDVVAFVTNHLKYNLLMERAKHLLGKAFVNNQISSDYKLSLIKLNEALTSDAALESYPYRRLASYYLDYITSIVPLDSQITYINSAFTGKTKNFMLFRLFSNYASSNPKFFKANNKIFYDLVKDEAYKKYVSNLIKDDESSLLAKDLEIYNLNGEAFSFADIIRKNTGKVIYIDFWASWCSPCIDEFPSSTSLAKKYATKDIVFIYISLDKNRNLWESALKRLSINQDQSYLVPTAFSSKLASRFKISSIPRYILIGKDGKVIHSDELRPSDPKLLEKLDQLL
jgi:thiol-disulfide isomerase/thioredoxin